MPGKEFKNNSWAKKEQLFILFISLYCISAPTGLHLLARQAFVD